MTAPVDVCLNRYLAGQASDEDVRSLGERLRSDAALRKELLVLAVLEGELPGALLDVTRKNKEKAHEAAATIPAAGTRPAPIRTETRRPLSRRLLWPAAIAAGILAIVGLIAYSTGRPDRPGRTEMADTPPASPPAAAKAEGRLTEISGEVWVARADGTGQPVPAEVGRQVFAGEAILTATNASAQFAYADGSTLRIFRASGVVLSRTDAGPGLELRRGAIDADIRKQPEGRHLRILGELMHAEIVGTQFRLMAGSRSKWLGVREGIVEVSRMADGQKVVLQAGNYAAVAPNWPYMRMDARVCPVWKDICRQAAGTPYP